MPSFQATAKDFVVAAFVNDKRAFRSRFFQVGVLDVFCLSFFLIRLLYFPLSISVACDSYDGS